MHPDKITPNPLCVIAIQLCLHMWEASARARFSSAASGREPAKRYRWKSNRHNDWRASFVWALNRRILFEKSSDFIFVVEIINIFISISGWFRSLVSFSIVLIRLNSSLSCRFSIRKSRLSEQYNWHQNAQNHTGWTIDSNGINAIS